jgi:hypothetical protein
MASLLVGDGAAAFRSCVMLAGVGRYPGIGGDKTAIFDHEPAVIDYSRGWDRVP